MKTGFSKSYPNFDYDQLKLITGIKQDARVQKTLDFIKKILLLQGYYKANEKIEKA